MARLTSLLNRLSTDGYKLEDEKVVIIEGVDSQLQNSFGDIAQTVQDVRNRYEMLKQDAYETQLHRLDLASDGVDVYVDELEATAWREKVIQSSQTREDLTLWLKHIEDDFVRPDLVEGNANRVYRSGGIKSPEGIARQMNNPVLMDTYHSRTRDITRGRIICDDLDAVVETGEQMIQKYDRQLWAFINYYSSPMQNKNGKDRFHFAYHGILLFDTLTPYELQIVTKNADAVSALNHPILRRNNLNLDEDYLAYVKALTWGAHLLDYERYLKVVDE